MRKIEKILIHQKTGKKFFVKDKNEEFHTSFGIITAKNLSADKEIVESSKNEKFIVLEPKFSDLWEDLLRGPQVMIHKDIGMILAKTGANHTFKVADAGGGSGSLCFSLANVCSQITVYEINPEHYKILSKNKDTFGLQNITLKQENIYEGIEENDLDLITLDLPEPWKVLEHAEQKLKIGGHLVIYLPNLTQVKLFVDSVGRGRIKVVETLELIERKWKIEDKIMRPEFEMLGHTGFLVFCRKF